MKIYLAGPMTGHPQHNFPLFNHVAVKLRTLGHEVMNPADLTISTYGTIEQFEQAPEDERIKVVRSLLARELSWICLHADAVYLLPGWENSFGARAEREAACAVKIEVHMVPEELLP